MNRQCSAGGCEKSAKNKGMCWGHYARWRRHGDPLAGRTSPTVKPDRCIVEECDMSVKSGQMCSKHYTRWLRHGDAGTKLRAAQGEPMAWLEAHVDHIGEECLIWPFAGTGTSNGYGVVTCNGIQRHAANVMCRLAHGEPPTNKHEAAHSCGNGHLGCVHPGHLRWATRSENHADKHLHGTMYQGEGHHFAHLSDDVVGAIRRSDLGMTEAAKRFGVSRGYVWELRTGRRRRDTPTQGSADRVR